MKTTRIVALTLVGVAIGVIAGQITSQRSPVEPVAVPSPSQPVASPAATTNGERRLGPFSIGGNSYSVVLHDQPQSPGSTRETGSTVALMEIQDSSGAVQFRRTFSSASSGDAFSDAWSVSAQILSGSSSSGLLITYQLDSEPSAPTPEDSAWWQLFGVVDGKLRPFSGPISVQGAPLSTNSKSDLIEFKVWAHHFRLVFPVAVNWTEGKLSPAPCQPCEYKVLPEDMSQREDLTFVRMCSSPEPKCEKPERTLVKKDSVIQLIAAKADVRWKEGLPSGPPGDSKDSMADQGEISVPDDVWLKLRIDGKEGWLHDAEDFTVLTLPFEQ